MLEKNEEHIKWIKVYFTMNSILFYLLRIKIPVFRFLDGQAITNVKSAMKLWEKDTCLRFREYHSASGTSDRIVFVGAQGYVIQIHMYMFAYTVPSYVAIIGASAARFWHTQLLYDPLLNSRQQVCVLRHCIILCPVLHKHNHTTHFSIKDEHFWIDSDQK